MSRKRQILKIGVADIYPIWYGILIGGFSRDKILKKFTDGKLTLAVKDGRKRRMINGQLEISSGWIRGVYRDWESFDCKFVPNDPEKLQRIMARP